MNSNCNVIISLFFQRGIFSIAPVSNNDLSARTYLVVKMTCRYFQVIIFVIDIFARFLTCVAFDLKQNNLQKQLIYVTFSRCTSLAGLFLFGRKHIFEGLNFNKMNEKERLAKAKELDQKNPVSIELKRMKNDVPFVNQFTFLDCERNNKYINSMFHNIAAYRRKYLYLNSDLVCKNVILTRNQMEA